jgi:hypothetical protein
MRPGVVRYQKYFPLFPARQPLDKLLKPFIVDAPFIQFPEYFPLVR